MDKEAFVAQAKEYGYDDAEIAELVKLHDDDNVPYDEIPLIERIVD